MAFDLATWRRKAGERLAQVNAWADRAKTEHAPRLVYATLCGASLWPLVEAARSGQVIPVAVALGAIAGGVGGNLIAEQIQRWQDAADEVDEDAVTHWVQEHVEDPEVREALDQVIEKLDAIAVAQAQLAETGRRRFDQQLRSELGRLGNLPRFEAGLMGSGAIVQGSGKGGGERAVVADRLDGIAQTGDGNVAIRADRVELHPPPSSPAVAARVRYLRRLSQRCKALPLAAMGGDEDAGDTVRLDQVYISLDADSCEDIEPAGGPRVDVDVEAQRCLALDVATQARRLALLGGPGAARAASSTTWPRGLRTPRSASAPVHRDGSRVSCRCS